MKTYISHGWSRIASLLGVGLSLALGCTVQSEELGVQQQALLCKSVDVCDDGNTCTDDLCIANLCVHEPLLNCLPGAEGGAGAGGVDGSDASGGRAGSHNGQGGTANSAGTHAGGTSTTGGTGPGDDTAAGASSRTTDTPGAAGEGGSDGRATSGEGSAGEATHQPGDDGQAGGSQWAMQGGACTLGRPSSGCAWEVTALLAFGLVLRQRRARARRGAGS